MGAQQSRGKQPVAQIGGGGRIPSGSGAPRPMRPGSGMAFTGGVGVAPAVRAGESVGVAKPPQSPGDVKQVFDSK
jgi:hypothetical protein